jgi:5-(carboxyamino)imidazole ribonucleotide synthase
MPDKPLPPGSTVGILGGGQLGRMLALAAARLGLRVAIFSPEAGSPAFDVAAQRFHAAYDDAAALGAFARQCGVVTIEFENVPVKTLEVIERQTRVHPPRRALAVAQDRIAEKRFLASLGLPLGAWEPVEEGGSLREAFARLTAGTPAAAQPMFLKRARHGYDGKGQMKIAGPANLEAAEDWLGGGTAVLEAAVPFALEISMIAARGRRGEMVFYDPPQNTHEDGILRESAVPACVAQSTRRAAEDHARIIAAALDYVGVLAVEMFVAREEDGAERLLINETAPRVHNSGHWTAEACAISQFENHIRAVAGWPLGDTARHSDARMVNLLGDEAQDWQALIDANPRRAVHLYGKAEARPGRKMGHYVDIVTGR